MAGKPKTLGPLIREARLAKGYSLRKFAEFVGVSPTYLSLVEQDKLDRPPTAERMRRMAELLGADPDEWIALAGRVPEDVAGIVRSAPKDMPELLRAAKGLTIEQLRSLAEQARRMKKDKD